jgi:alkanesulfonate monooxygenase SsuD/methylene tetrahydromethanopterin reductase-like flavin-dependent oxidoreductase (luciferase family)
MASNRKRKKDNEEEKTLIERLLEEEELKEEGTGIPKAAPGDVLPSPQQPMMQQGGGGGGSSFLGTILPTAARIGLGYLTGGGSTFASGFAGAPALGFEEGGQIKKKTKKTKKKNKRYVRGVGAAKRGYGKATYSKKMY